MEKNTSDLWSDSALNILQTCQDATDAFDTTWRRSCARIAPFWHDMPPARPWGPVDELMGGGALVSWCITVLALPQAILKRCNLQVYLYITLYNAFQLNIYLCVCKNIYIYLWLCVCVRRKIEKARVWSPLLALADSHHLLRLLRLSSNSSSTVGADTPTFPRKRRKWRASATRGRNPVETQH